MCIPNHSSGLVNSKRKKQTRWLVLEHMDPDLVVDEAPVSVEKDGTLKVRKKVRYNQIKIEKASAFNELRLPFIKRISFIQLAPKDTEDDKDGLGPLQAYIASTLRTVGTTSVVSVHSLFVACPE